MASQAVSAPEESSPKAFTEPGGHGTHFLLFTWKFARHKTFAAGTGKHSHSITEHQSRSTIPFFTTRNVPKGSQYSHFLSET